MVFNYYFITMNLYVKSRIFKPSLISSLFRYSSTIPVDQNEQVLVEDVDNNLAREAEIEKKRNKSRLNKSHFNIINGRRPYDEPKCHAHLTVKYNRKMYGLFGSMSGVEPSLCWPTKEDIQEKLEYESVAYPYTIEEMMEMAAQKKNDAEQRIQLREKEVAAKYVKLNQWKKELQDKLAKKEADAKTAKAKKERLVEEVRKHFGFKLDPRDERFQEMLEKREKEQRKAEKLLRKEAKEKKMIAILQQKSAAMNEKA